MRITSFLPLAVSQNADMEVNDPVVRDGRGNAVGRVVESRVVEGGLELVIDLDVPDLRAAFGARVGTDKPAGLDTVPPVMELGGAVGRRATTACRQGQHDLCDGKLPFMQPADQDCLCRCHGRVFGD